MSLPFVIVALLTVAAAVAAMALRNLVHCALSLVVMFAGLAALFLQLNAEFVGFAQILVYIGAVAILIVFAILLTRGNETEPPAPIATATPWGVAIAVAAFVTLAGAVLKSSAVWQSARHVLLQVGANRVIVPLQNFTEPSAPVAALGDRLMREYVLPLEVVGLLLTAALIGAAIIAMPEKPRVPSETGPTSET